MCVWEGEGQAGKRLSVHHISLLTCLPTLITLSAINTSTSPPCRVAALCICMHMCRDIEDEGENGGTKREKKEVLMHNWQQAVGVKGIRTISKRTADQRLYCPVVCNPVYLMYPGQGLMTEPPSSFSETLLSTCHTVTQ